MRLFLSLLLVGFFAAVAQADTPASTSYKLKSFVVGGSGEDDSNSTSYRLEGTAGEQSGEPATSTLYKIASGYYPTQQANVPGAPTATNVNNDYYNKLHLVIDTGGNPTDTLFAIAVSTDDFASDIRYVQNDNTVGATLELADYQTYAAWGSGSGFNVIGLAHSTTYYFKVKALHGDFTETGYGPTDSAATIAPYLTFDIDVAASDTETDPPFVIEFGSLTTAVNTASDKIWVDWATNAEAGGFVYVAGENAGLTSSSTGYTIDSASADLAVVSEGFGLQVSSVAESSGGPLTAVSPYNGSSDNVGIVDNAIRPALTTAGPLGGGRASMALKARRADLTPAANDYQEVITVVASASF